MFVPPTPGGLLAKKLRIREEELNNTNKERIKIQEKGGIDLVNILGKKNPFNKEKCKEKSCPFCENSSKNSNIQETSRSLKIRTAEHIKAFEKNTEKRVLYKHKLTDHKEEEKIEFEIEVTGKFKDALTKQANEAVRINSRKSTEILNSKCEFNHPPLVRVVVEKKKTI